jgi:beta-N-acetylhexosaminidase
MITLRNKIGQMLVMGFEGCQLNDTSPIAHWLENDGLGGVILFDKEFKTGTYGKNLKDQAQIKQLISQLHDYSARSTQNQEHIPLFTAIDYEGGAVDRLSKIPGCMVTLDAIELAKLSAADLDEELQQMAETVKSLGFNLNFAPVVDLNLNEEQGIIGRLKRSYSAD